MASCLTVGARNGIHALALKLAIANEYGARSVRPYVDSIRLCDVESSPFEIHACEEFWDGMSSSS